MMLEWPLRTDELPPSRASTRSLNRSTESLLGTAWHITLPGIQITRVLIQPPALGIFADRADHVETLARISESDLLRRADTPRDGNRRRAMLGAPSSARM